MTIEAITATMLATIGTLIVAIASRASEDIRKMAASAEELNVTLAVICEKVAIHEKRIEKLEFKVKP